MDEDITAPSDPRSPQASHNGPVDGPNAGAPAEHSLRPGGTPTKQSRPPGSTESSGHPRRSRRVWPWVIVVILLAAGALYWLRENPVTPAAGSGSAKAGKSGKGSAGGAATNVIATRAQKGNIDVYFAGLLGSVTPINTVTVRSRVDGELMIVHYREGDLVKKGELLVEIDPKPYQATLTQAEGQLLRDQALLENARIDLSRYELLIKTKAVPEQMLATQAALVKQDEGTVKTDEGTVESAKVNVGYTKITAPIAGRIGLRLVDPGNIVHSTDSNGLLVITQVDPISVIFTVSEDQIPTVVQKTRAGQKLQVDAFDREMKNKLAAGTLTTIDNEIDQTTGTVRIRATFDNKNATLFPNQFVNARILVETHRGVVVLASAAIQRTSNSQFVYLVQPDSTVTIRNITVGVTEGNNSEIISGLSAGDVAVMAGADKLEEGSKVNPQIQGEQPGQGAPASQSGPGGQGKSGAAKGTGSKQTGSKQTRSKSTGAKQP
jgi:multidrug efflux system membrane fusion protein